jgi:prephenate dehydrogenase
MGPFLKPGAIVTDVGSVKGSVVREMEPLARQAGAEFVGSHPMAGSEKTGVAAARADLFENAICLVTPGRMHSAGGHWRGGGFLEGGRRPSHPHDARGA